jgi:uncharacterized protein YdhG (YjbR/CyaY superfamily)
VKKSGVTEYLTSLREPQRSALERIRKIVLEIVPTAVEGIYYGVPGFKYEGKYLMGYAAAKNHMSIFPTSGPIEDLKEKLGGYNLSKGTIRFTPDTPLPEPLLKEIVLNRLGKISNR